VSDAAVCASCVWYVQATGSAWGMCRRFPDYVVRQVDDWCGEHPQLVTLRRGTQRFQLAPPEG
jgi:hypothetical protein